MVITWNIINSSTFRSSQSQTIREFQLSLILKMLKISSTTMKKVSVLTKEVSFEWSSWLLKHSKVRNTVLNFIIHSVSELGLLNISNASHWLSITWLLKLNRSKYLLKTEDRTSLDNSSESRGPLCFPRDFILIRTKHFNKMGSQFLNLRDSGGVTVREMSF